MGTFDDKLIEELRVKNENNKELKQTLQNAKLLPHQSTNNVDHDYCNYQKMFKSE